MLQIRPRTSLRLSGVQRQRSRRGFTLLEAVMAAGVLLIIVVSVAMAITAGQQHGFEAQQRIAATMAAEELMGRLSAVEQEDLRSQWHGYREEPGEMVDVNGHAFPAPYSAIGRSVVVGEAVKINPKTGVNILGRTLVVRAFDANDRTLAEISRFIAISTPGMTSDEMNGLLVQMNAEP